MLKIIIIGLAVVLGGCASGFDSDLDRIGDGIRNACHAPGTVVNVSVVKSDDRSTIKASCSWEVTD